MTCFRLQISKVLCSFLVSHQDPPLSLNANERDPAPSGIENNLIPSGSEMNEFGPSEGEY